MELSNSLHINKSNEMHATCNVLIILTAQHKNNDEPGKHAHSDSNGKSRYVRTCDRKYASWQHLQTSSAHNVFFDLPLALSHGGSQVQRVTEVTFPKGTHPGTALQRGSSLWLRRRLFGPEQTM